MKLVGVTDPFPSDSSLIGGHCNKVEHVRRKAQQNASAKYPDKMTKQASYGNMLFDDYALMLFREYDIHATHYSTLALCVDDGLF